MATKIGPHTIDLTDELCSHFFTPANQYAGVDLDYIEEALKARGITYTPGELTNGINELIRRKEFDLIIHSPVGPGRGYCLRLRRHKEVSIPDTPL